MVNPIEVRYGHFVRFSDVCLAVSGRLDVQSVLPPTMHAAVNSDREYLVVGDVAGRDSVAAILATFEKEQYTQVIPVMVDNGVGVGDWRQIDQNISLLRAVAYTRYRGVVYDYLAVQDYDLWWLLNGRYVSDIVRKYGFYSPCPGCHLYFHAMRAVIAEAIGSTAIICGSRESHNGQLKVNQLPTVLDIYSEFLQARNVQLLLPLRRVVSGGTIERIIGVKWEQGERFLKCVFRDNYRSVHGNDALPETEAIRVFLSEFAVPLVNRLLQVRIRDPYDTRSLVAVADRFARCNLA